MPVRNHITYLNSTDTVAKASEAVEQEVKQDLQKTVAKEPSKTELDKHEIKEPVKAAAEVSDKEAQDISKKEKDTSTEQSLEVTAPKTSQKQDGRDTTVSKKK